MQTDEFSRASIEHPERNEDAFLLMVGNENVAPVFAVIDGMGGHQHTNQDGKLITGHEASEAVRQVLQEVLKEIPADVSADEGELAEEKLFIALDRANEVLFDELNQGQMMHGRRVGAVCTVALLCENGKRLLVGQIGDTRAYLLRSGQLLQVCEDEDNVRYLVQSGIMSEADGQKISALLNNFDGISEPVAAGKVNIFAQDYDLSTAWHWFLEGNPALQIPGANAVMAALGIDDECPFPQMMRLDIREGDQLLMVSDGIYKNLSEVELLAQLNEAINPAQACGEAAYKRSQDAFNRRSTTDDITVVYAKFD